MVEFSSWESLPVILQAKHIQAILGISKGAAYQLMNRQDFPTIFLGNKRMVVPRDAFQAWLNDSRRQIRRRPIYVSHY